MDNGDAKNQAPGADNGPRAQRVNLLFYAVLGGIALVVLALLIAFSVQDQLTVRTRATVLHSRAVRAEVLSVTDALIDLEAGRRAQAQRRVNAQDTIAGAREKARRHLDVLVDQSERDPSLNEAALHYAALVEEALALNTGDPRTLDRADALRQELSASAAMLVTLTNAEIDEVRGAQDALRGRMEGIALALGLLALTAAALALLALRRERAHWRQAHAIAERARAQASASDLAKSRFLAAASHDMRQPLHALTLYLSALDRRVQNPEAREILAKMERATQSMVGMFSTLLDLARIQAGIINPENADVPMQEIIDRIIAENPGGRIVAAPTALGVHTDAVLLERVLRNLIANALRHGGGDARIECAEVGERVHISVSDDGPGISAEDQERIYEEFVRLDGRGGSDGLGLGLAIVKRICAMLGFTLELRSAPGKGARFIVGVPRAVGAATRPLATDADLSHMLRDVPVMVIDDDALAREAIAGAVRDMGADVRAFPDQAEAEAALDAGFAPRLLLADLRINGELRGFAIAAALRPRLAAPAGVIIVTGDTGPNALDALRASGHKWLIKPVDLRELSSVTAGMMSEPV
jgi:signal transduction histidine kinase